MASPQTHSAQPGPSLKTQVFEKLAQLAASLGSPGRLKLVQLLAQGPKTVEMLSQLSGQSVANTSQHLQRMAKDGLVYATKSGISRIYRIKSPRVLDLWERLQDLAHELSPELDKIEADLTDPSLRSPIPTDTIRKEIKKGKAILLDVREEFESSETPVLHAIAIPLSHLKKRAKEMSSRKTIYVFCRGRYCQMATEAVRQLRAKGFDAYRLRESAFRLNTDL